MQYIALIYRTEELDFDPNRDESKGIIEAYGAYTQKIIASGHFKAGDALMRSNSATCVQRRDNKISTTDGPFVESKEQLGGYYILDCEDLDDAIKTAADIPHAALGTVELRPIVA